MPGSISGNLPFNAHDEKQRLGAAACHFYAQSASGGADKHPGVVRLGRDLRMLLAEPEVRLLMRADGVNEYQLLEALVAIAAGLRKARDAQPGNNEASSSQVEEVPDLGRFRPGVGIVLLNRSAEVLVGCRVDLPEDAWQLPQGGIDAGETPRRAALRELKEEVGTDNVEMIAESQGWITYDVPAEIAEKTWGGRWRGQRQKWFVMLYVGGDDEIEVVTDHPEFRAWRWVPWHQLPTLAVSFKRPLYQSIAHEFDIVVVGRTRR
jgi:putative (di)nucleoside polyphosphate hydrolase